MSILKNLKLAASIPTAARDAKQTARTKLLRYLKEQKAIAQADIEGRAYSATKIVFSNDENGRRVRAEALRMVRRGWADADGTVLFQLKYGSKPLQLAKGMTAVEVGKLDALPTIIDTLIEATNGGELDQQLAAAAAERRANFKQKVR
jgi:hypothetical protein